MKKLVSIILILLFAVTPVYSAVPLAIPIVYSLLMHSIAAALGIYFTMKPGTPPTVSATGEISRSAEVQWINTADLTIGGTPTVQKKNVTAKISPAQAANISSNNKSAYPNTYNATVSPATLPNSVIVRADGSKVKLGSSAVSSYDGNNACTISLHNGFINDRYYSCSGVTSSNPANGTVFRAYSFASADSTAPVSPSVPSSGSVISAKMSGTAAGGNLSAAYQAEIDKMLQDPSYVPTFTDDTTGLPFAYPPNDTVATPQQLNTYNAKQSAKESAVTASASAQSAVASTAAAASNAGNNYTASGGNITTGAGGDAALYQKYLDAKGVADKAMASADQLQASQDQQSASDVESSNYSSPSMPSAYGDGSDFDFSGRMTTFMTTMQSSSVFGMPTMLIGNVPTGGESTFNFNFGRFGNHTFDLASFSVVLTIMRSLVLICFTIIAIKIITLKGGSG